MREIQTFILRLMVDTQDPDALRGMLRRVADDTSYSFADADALLRLLRRLGAVPAQINAPSATATEANAADT